jgi:hypothetical protein
MVDADALMGERNRMKRPAVFASLAILGGLVCAAAADAAPLRTNRSEPVAVTDVSAQSQTKRVRPRIRVTPRYPYRTWHSPYPLPYTYEYPGPGATRDCRAKLVQEYRPSGTVIVPRMQCWWVPG